MHLADMSIQSDLLRNFSETIKFNKWYCLSGCFSSRFCLKFLCVRLGLDRDYLMSLIWSLFDMHTYSAARGSPSHLCFKHTSTHSWLTGCSVYVSVSCCVMETALSICFSSKHCWYLLSFCVTSAPHPDFWHPGKSKCTDQSREGLWNVKYDLWNCDAYI